MPKRPSAKAPAKHSTARKPASRHGASTASKQRRRALHSQIRAARPIHKRIMLHPAMGMTLLIVGVLITGWTLHSSADSYSITAKVAAPPLTEGAVITSPSDGASFTAVPITVSGTCPSNSYVTLTRNGAFSGSAACATGGTFDIQTSLSAGSNTLLAQDYNITDDPGPATLPITVTYTPPPPPVQPPSSSTTTSPSVPTQTTTSPLIVNSDYHFQAFAVNGAFSWEIKVSGGTAPYSMRVEWGDGQTSAQTIPAAQTVTIRHRYTKAGYYPILVHVTDAKAFATLLQIAAFIKLPGTAGALFTSPTSTDQGWFNNLLSTLVGTKYYLWLAWPTYIVVVLMAVSFWLGERQELHQLAMQPVSIKHTKRR